MPRVFARARDARAHAHIYMHVNVRARAYRRYSAGAARYSLDIRLVRIIPSLRIRYTLFIIRDILYTIPRATRAARHSRASALQAPMCLSPNDISFLLSISRRVRPLLLHLHLLSFSRGYRLKWIHVDGEPADIRLSRQTFSRSAA